MTLKPREIRRLTPAEREKRLEELYNELSSIRIQMATGGGTENPFRAKNVKKSIARILTIQREEELKEGMNE
jgi:large subunit ribosomal protein L29